MATDNKIEQFIEPTAHFLRARKEPVPAKRLEKMRALAKTFGDQMRQGPKVRFFKSVPLVRAPYPAKYGFLNARAVQFPFIHIINRLFIVQVDSADGIKTLLLSPTWVDGSRKTPFFDRLSDSFGPLRDWGDKVIAPVLNTVEGAVADAGLAPEDIDYISYDHLHTQDLRRWLGGSGYETPYFPNAKLLVMQEEWQAVKGLAAPQADWYPRDGIKGVSEDKIVILKQDVLVGEGLAIVRTPGHTMGNHSFVVNTPEGVFVISENGIGVDSYAPQYSRISALRKYANDTGMEVVLNGNTLEGGLEQYISMVVEKEIAGPSHRNPRFPNMFNSSEFTHYWLFPGHRPSMNVGDKEFGRISLGRQKQAKAA